MNQYSVVLVVFVFLAAIFYSTSVNHQNLRSQSNFVLLSPAPSIIAPNTTPQASPNLTQYSKQKADEIIFQVDSMISLEKDNVAKYEMLDNQYNAQALDLITKIQQELKLDMDSGGHRKSMAASEQVQLDSVTFLSKLNARNLIAAEYRLSELEAAKSGDFAYAYQLQQEYDRGQLIDSQKDVSNKLDQLLIKVQKLNDTLK